jgi:dimethylargininase
MRGTLLSAGGIVKVRYGVPMPVAIMREVSPSINECQLTFLRREPIDVARAMEQHRLYRIRLQVSGWDVKMLPADAALPDSVFIEDTAVVLPEAVIMTRPGAESRRGELAAVAESLRPLRTVASMEGPGTLDGGDVLLIGKRLYAGLSTRTNQEGIDELSRLTQPHGYEVTPVPVSQSLHLKSAVTAVGPHAVLLNPDWIDAELFTGLRTISIHSMEPFSANVLALDDVVLVSTQHPRTRERLEKSGVKTDVIDVSELAKAEGALTCCSLLVR